MQTWIICSWLMGQAREQSEEADLKFFSPVPDPSRVYISGLSVGGAFSFMMGIKHSDIFAVAAPVSGVNSFALEIQEALKDYSGHGTPLGKGRAVGKHYSLGLFYILFSRLNARLRIQFLYGHGGHGSGKNTLPPIGKCRIMNQIDAAFMACREGSRM